ncbi:Uma2 family endonuclease [Lusitaniella coriacea LEGE 07157]|uniref:Uma2 family endonuclease n=1 Tax=Lusitaniella coriacea LEGE 07157 TaxID=945747 RepID=A0A8J7DYP4_9CYAN|nr:Uma2 family endonuclease [Lusitaniella coriacea]MBE9117939.1 Uma2 family endonuclease [Lusitaniella coriacea LEGE 07157]
MIASSNYIYLTPEEYLKFEEESDVKHEYIDGYAYAMAGAIDAHVTIAGNLFTLLRSHVRGLDCRAYISDMKARIESLNRYFYPDVMVTCDRRDPEGICQRAVREMPNYKQFPCLIVEVLSDSTEAFDRGDKFADYQQLESLQEYVLVNVKRPRVECFRRNSERLWVLQSYTAESETFELQSINFAGTMQSLYEDVEFDAIAP